jgi:hypothetical protein
MTAWLTVWIRAVIAPATRRALPVWIGAGLVAAVVFGGTGMQPSDLTGLAMAVPLVGAALAVTWLLLYVPTARVIVRAEGARYLRSLPAAPWPPRVIGALALVGLQLPWLALWVVGAHAVGAAIVVALTAVIAALAIVRLPPRRVATPRWRTDRTALLGIYARALRRRAGDALVRGAGLAILAGIAAALFVRNNDLDARAAAVLASAVIAVVLVPAWAGVLLPLVEAHRASAWLASSTGISERSRTAVLAAAIGVVYVLATLIAVAVAGIVFATATPRAGVIVDDTYVAPAATSLAHALGWLLALALVDAVGLALLATRAIVWAERSQAKLVAPNTTQRAIDGGRVILGAVLASALAVVALGYFDAVGALALLAAGILAVSTT